MAKIALISLYDNWALGIRALSNALFSHGHDVTVVHFKLPAQKQLDDFLDHPMGYENLQSRQSHSEVILTGYNMDVSMWTSKECELLGNLLLDLGPDIIGITTRTLYEKYLNPIIEQMQRSTSAIKLAGGFGASMNPVFYIDQFDYVCVGEGEQAIVKMAEYIDMGLKTKIRNISNLVYKVSGQVVVNDMEKPDDSKDYFFNSQMDQIPHYIIENDEVGKTDVFIEYVRQIDPSFAGLSNYYTMVGRGCMWNCSFCSAGQFYRLYSDNGIPIKKRRNRKIEKIIEELRLAKEHGFTRIYFMDSFLIGEESYLLEFFDLYKKKVKIPFFAQLFPDQVLRNPKILEKAVEAGMAFTVAGIQSGSEHIRNKIYNRKNTNDSIIKFSNMISSYRSVFLEYHIITHNPFETIEDIKETFDLIGKLPKDNAQIMLLRLRPFQGSAISNMIKQAKLGDIDENYYHKIFILYLIRYHVAGDEFEKIFANFDAYSHMDLKKIYAEIRKKFKNSSDWAMIGWENYHKAKYEEAIKAFNSAIDMDPFNSKALDGRGWANYQEKRFETALKDFKAAVKNKAFMEKDVLQEVFRGVAWVYYCLQDYKETVKYFNKALEQTDTKNSVVLQDIFRGLGWAYYQKKDIGQSRKCFQKAIDNIGTDNKSEILSDALHGLELGRKEKSNMEIEEKN